jgi:long-subunit fatty acid transport protein
MSAQIRRACATLVAAGALAVAGSAGASGYDTPMLYSARHMGMGGTAIGYVQDPSAIFHNPAGLAQIQRGQVLGDFSLLLGGLHASPNFAAKDLDSQLTVAPFFLVAAGYRLHQRIVIGLGVYPVASSGASYRYGATEDRTDLFFLEASPSIAFNLLSTLRVGVGYRLTYVRLVRYTGQPGSATNPLLDFTLTGQNFSGFRAGVEWAPRPWLEFGAVFRNPTTTTVHNAHGTAFSSEFSDVATKFKLPAKLGFGSRLDFEPFGLRGALAADLEYTFNRENAGYPLTGIGPADSGAQSVPNVFQWSNATTLRFGFEKRIWRSHVTELDRLALRVGYVYDSKTANAQYPTAFGTPPGPTQVVTAGTGYNGGAWQMNLAYAYRFGHGRVTANDINSASQQCRFCGTYGKDDYAIHLHGIYVDASYKF